MTHKCCQDQRGWRKSCTILYTQKIGHYDILRFLSDARSGIIASANYKLTGPEDQKAGGAEDQSSRGPHDQRTIGREHRNCLGPGNRRLHSLFAAHLPNC